MYVFVIDLQNPHERKYKWHEYLLNPSAFVSVTLECQEEL